MITSLPKTLSRASWKSYVSPQSRCQPLKSVVRLHEPKSYEEVIKDPTHSRLWREAINDELDSLAMHHTIRIFTGFRNQPHRNMCTYHNNKHHGPRIRFNSYLLTFGAGKNVARRLNYKRPEDLFVKRSSEKSHHWVHWILLTGLLTRIQDVLLSPYTSHYLDNLPLSLSRRTGCRTWPQVKAGPESRDRAWNRDKK